MSTKFDEISGAINAQSHRAVDWMSARVIETTADAEEAEKLRRLLAGLKQDAEDARDAERLPLIEAAQAVQAKFAPKLATLKRADDLLRHGLKAWKKRQKQKPT